MIPAYQSVSDQSRQEILRFCEAHGQSRSRLQSLLATLQELPAAVLRGSWDDAAATRDRLRGEIWAAYGGLLDECSTADRMLVVILAELTAAVTATEAGLDKARSVAEKALRKAGMSPETATANAAANPDQARLMFERMIDRAEPVLAATSSARQAVEDRDSAGRLSREIRDQAVAWADARRRLAEKWLV